MHKSDTKWFLHHQPNKPNKYVFSTETMDEELNTGERKTIQLPDEMMMMYSIQTPELWHSCDAWWRHQGTLMMIRQRNVQCRSLCTVYTPVVSVQSVQWDPSKCPTVSVGLAPRPWTSRTPQSVTLTIIVQTKLVRTSRLLCPVNLYLNITSCSWRVTRLVQQVGWCGWRVKKLFGTYVTNMRLCSPVYLITPAHTHKADLGYYRPNYILHTIIPSYALLDRLICTAKWKEISELIDTKQIFKLMKISFKIVQLFNVYIVQNQKIDLQFLE